MISGLVLAAGTSSRLGRPKQLLALAGRPVIDHVVHEALRSVLDEVIVVLGAGAEEVRAVLPPDGRVRPVVNPRFATGQASSLACGLGAAGGSDAAVVLLGDQPGVRSEAIDAVIAEWTRAPAAVVQASYGGRPGHPTLFGRSIWWRLASLRGDQGARSLLKEHPDWVRPVEVEGEVPDDIDTEEDYLRVRALFEIRRD